MSLLFYPFSFTDIQLPKLFDYLEYIGNVVWGIREHFLLSGCLHNDTEKVRNFIADIQNFFFK